MLKNRTEGEMKAYVDGYNAAFKQFCEYLKGKYTIRGAIEMMQIIVAAVNGTVETSKGSCEKNDR